MRRGLAVAAGFVGLVASTLCVPLQTDKPFSHSIAPRKIAEECVKLAAGDTIAYAFDATAPVDFNIHFHQGDAVVYPVKSDQIQRADDRFTATSAEDYCLMWTNRTPQTISVTGQLRL